MADMEAAAALLAARLGMKEDKDNERPSGGKGQPRRGILVDSPEIAMCPEKNEVVVQTRQSSLASGSLGGVGARRDFTKPLKYLENILPCA
jgi:hypothetical protein